MVSADASLRDLPIRGVAQPGSAHGSGPWGRRFKSSRPDQEIVATSGAMAKGPAAVRVLVVDDDKSICDYMETFLTKDGFKVKTLSDPSLVAEEVKDGGYHLVV